MFARLTWHSQIDNCEQPWTFPEDSIDYVHLRYLTGSPQNWDFLLEQAFICAKAGCYVENLEAVSRFQSDDGTVKDDSPMAQWGKLFLEGGKILGRIFTIVDDGTQRSAMDKAGFIGIQEHEVKVCLGIFLVLINRQELTREQVPIGKWPRDAKLKELGQFAFFVIDTDVEGYVTYMADLQGWSKKEIMVYAAHLRREIRNSAIHGYYSVKVVWGRKPEA